MSLAVNLAMIAGGLAAVVAVLAPLVRRLGRLEHGVTAIWRGFFGAAAEDGQPARPGVMERLSAQDAELARIRAQLAALSGKGNGGAGAR